MSSKQKSGKARQDDDVKSLAEARKHAEQPAGEFEIEHEGARKPPEPDHDQRR